MADAGTGLKGRIQSHPVTAFFILAFLISWITWSVAPLITGGDKALTDAIDLIGVFGPALSAILVSSITDPAPSNQPKRKRAITFSVIFTLSIVFQLFSLITTNRFGFISALTLAVLSIIAAYVVSSVYHPKQGVARLMSGLKRISPRSIWIWVAALLPLMFQVIGALTDWSLGGTELFSVSVSTFVAVLVSYPLIFFFGGPLNEEPGWRGFATPRLQTKYTPLLTGLIIGLIWTIWHFPLHFTSFYGDGLDGFLLRFVVNIPLGVMFTWLYNRSAANLFACIILHTSINALNGVFGEYSGLYASIVMVIFTAAVVLTDKMYKKQQGTGEENKEPNKIGVKQLDFL